MKSSSELRSRVIELSTRRKELMEKREKLSLIISGLDNFLVENRQQMQAAATALVLAMAREKAEAAEAQTKDVAVEALSILHPFTQ